MLVFVVVAYFQARLMHCCMHDTLNITVVHGFVLSFIQKHKRMVL